MSHCIVPDWNSRKQRQRQEEIEGDQDHVSCVRERADGTNHMGLIGSINYEVGELAWDNYNRQPAVPLHGHGGIQLLPQTKPTWGSTRTGDTLESLVHQATFSNTTQLRHRGNLGPTYSASSIPISSAGKQVVGSFKSESSSGVKWRENSTLNDMEQNLAANLSSMTASSCGKWWENSSHMQMEENDHGVKIGSMPTHSGLKISSIEDYSGRKRAENSSSGLVSKRIRSESVKCLGKNCSQVEERGSSAGGCVGASASATFCKENTDTTMMTWASPESAPSKKIPRNVGNDSAYQDFSDEEFENKEEIARSQSSTRRGRDAVVHNESERRRRDKINEKLKALQKLVPNANKTDKASMLDEVIKYLKQLQAQVQTLSNARAMPHQMVMPLGMQQQLQMSLLGRIGLGTEMGMGPVGMGIVDVNNLARNMPQRFTPLLHGAMPLSTTAPSFVSPPFPVPSLVPPLAQLKANVNAANINGSMPDFNDSYGTFLAQQSMNMDFYNRMTSLYRQQAWQPSKKPDSMPRQNNVQGD